MRVDILKSNITDLITYNAGMEEVKALLIPIKNILPFIFTEQEVNVLFTGQTFYNKAVGSGVLVDASQILTLANTKKTDIEFLIFDALKVFPHPSNPAHSDIKSGICTVCQMPMQWYNNAVDTFAIYFLHEICHAMYYLLRMRHKDMTHLLNNMNLDPVEYAKWADKPATDYYIHIITSLAPTWNLYKAGKLTMRILKRGMQGDDVAQLQHDLNDFGFNLVTDGKFGGKTEEALMHFQMNNGLDADGKAGPKTQDKIDSLSVNPSAALSKIDRWCEAAKIMEGAKPERNNPGNLRYIGQPHSVNDNGFCKFDTYEHGYEALHNLITNACIGKSRIYTSSGNLYDFYSVYAPSSDGNNPKHYAEFVARYIGVSPDTVISTLLY